MIGMGAIVLYIDVYLFIIPVDTKTATIVICNVRNNYIIHVLNKYYIIAVYIAMTLPCTVLPTQKHMVQHDFISESTLRAASSKKLYDNIVVPFS